MCFPIFISLLKTLARTQKHEKSFELVLFVTKKFFQHKRLILESICDLFAAIEAKPVPNEFQYRKFDAT